MYSCPAERSRSMTINSKQLKLRNPVKSPFFRFGKILLIGLFVIGFSVFYLYPQIFYCEFIGLSSFHKVAKGTYLSPDIKIRNYARFKWIITKSEARVDSFYQGRKSSPKIIICSNPQQYQKYCNSSEGAGCSIGTPWGNSYVILNAQGMNSDVIAHEMSHAELLEQLGWWNVTMKVPQWFNEGIALMLDRRFVNESEPAGRYLSYLDEWLYYTGGGQQILELNDIASIKGFYNGNQRHVMLAYMSSGMEIAYWLTLAGQQGFAGLIGDIRSGKSFEDSYRDAEGENAKVYFKKLPTNPLRFQDSKKMIE
jgi:hypothetical protein